MNNGDEILISHNALHDINRIFDYKKRNILGIFLFPQMIVLHGELRVANGSPLKISIWFTGV